MGTEMLETEHEIVGRSPGQVVAELTTAAALQSEATHQRVVFAWGQTLFTELGRVWGELDTAEKLAHEDKVAAQVHMLEEATASLELLSDTLEGTCRRLKQHLHSLRD
jgi:hypothetical protein